MTYNERMFSLFSSTKTDLGIIFDIGTSSVGAALVKFDQGKAPHIVFTVREMMTFQENVDPIKLFGFMLDALVRANTRISKEGVAHLKFTEHGDLNVRRVFFVFSSSCFFSSFTWSKSNLTSTFKGSGFIFFKSASICF
jgi:hypothetical protein